MKRSFCFFLALLMCALPLLGGCKKEEPAPEAPTVFTVAQDGTAYCKIIYDTGTGYQKRMQYADRLAAFIKLQTKVKPEAMSDEMAKDATGQEILIGSTNRPESAQVMEQITSECDYIIRVVGNKLVVVAGSDEALNTAIELLCSGSVPKTLGYFSRGGVMSFALDGTYEGRLPAMVKNVQHFATVCNIAEMDGHVVTQGGCTDGTYIYICMENQHGDYENSAVHTTIICKLRADTGELVKKSAPLKLDHSNDMAYNSKTGELVVVHAGINGKTISTVDPETLEIIRTRTNLLEFGTYAMAYNAATDEFVAGGSGGRAFSVYSGTYSYQNDYSSYNDGHITQGIDCDENYVYFILTGDGEGGVKDRNYGYLVITTHKGRHVATCRVPLPAGESTEIETECIFHIGNLFYVAYNTRDAVKAGHIHTFTIEGLE